jgi:hypothetical protein
MGLAPEKGLELVGEGARVGHKPGRAHDVLDLYIGRVPFIFLHCREQVLGMQDANNVVRLVLPHGKARVP